MVAEWRPSLGRTFFEDILILMVIIGLGIAQGLLLAKLANMVLRPVGTFATVLQYGFAALGIAMMFVELSVWANVSKKRDEK